MICIIPTHLGLPETHYLSVLRRDGSCRWTRKVEPGRVACFVNEKLAKSWIEARAPGWMAALEREGTPLRFEEAPKGAQRRVLH